MLSAQNRLRRRRDFQQLFRGGRVVRGKYIIARHIPTTGESLAGFVVSTTIFKNATDRNRLRRQLRAIVRGLGLPKHTNILFSATTAARHQPYATLQTEILKLLSYVQPQNPRR